MSTKSFARFKDLSGYLTKFTFWMNVAYMICFFSNRALQYYFIHGDLLQKSSLHKLPEKHSLRTAEMPLWASFFMAMIWTKKKLYVLDSSIVVDGVSTVFLPISCWVQIKNSWTRSLTGRLRPYHLVLATSKFTKSSTFPRQPVISSTFTLGWYHLLRCEMHSQISNIQQFQKGQTKTPRTQNSNNFTNFISNFTKSNFGFHPFFSSINLLHFPINPFAPRMINLKMGWMGT